MNNWQYVYYLKDHQNNVRVTFADDNISGDIETGSSYSEIRREQNYYPFGLEHKGYNTVMNGVKNNLKTFQDQEFTENLGLNTHEWRYRVSDPAIGRFWQVDPLAEEYVHNGTYNFSENRVIDAVELEGLEARLVIKDKIIGYTPQKVYGNQKGVTKVVVPVYAAILVDVQNPKAPIANYGVTRDAWYSRGVSSSGTELTNRAFEPANSNNNNYGTVPLEYPPGSDLDAFALRQNDSPKLDALPFSNEQNTFLDGSAIDDAREILSTASGVMLHIGGYYNNGSTNKLAGSYGCFGFICQSQIYSSEEDAANMIKYDAIGVNGTANDEFIKAINKILTVRNNSEGDKKVEITVEKRKNVKTSKTSQ